MSLLKVQNLNVTFETGDGPVDAVRDINLSVETGECLGIVGESGSGKSQTFLAMMGLLTRNGRATGSAMFDGQEMLNISAAEANKVRGHNVSMIFQDPLTALTPHLTVGQQMSEVLEVHKGMGGQEANRICLDWLDRVRIPEARHRINQYPHQLSGGMRQRVMIAIALACDPKVLIADEPTTALDVTIQAQIIELMKDIRTKLGMGVIWITHDLGVIAGIADRVMVMYGGQIVEHGTVQNIFKNPQHPYTKALLTTVPSVTGARADRLTTIEGQPPILQEQPQLCPFRDRCNERLEICNRMLPQRYPVGDGHDAACFLPDHGIRKVRAHA